VGFPLHRRPTGQWCVCPPISVRMCFLRGQTTAHEPVPTRAKIDSLNAKAVVRNQANLHWSQSWRAVILTRETGLIRCRECASKLIGRKYMALLFIIYLCDDDKKMTLVLKSIRSCISWRISRLKSRLIRLRQAAESVDFRINERIQVGWSSR